MPYEDITLDKQENGVALLTVNRPQRLNAVRWQSWDEIEDAIQCLASDDEVRALVITGSGRGFCAGTDLGAARALPDLPAVGRRERHRAAYSSTAKLIDCPIPTIAAVNGAAVGAGLSLALACDIRIASEAARFSAIWSRRGLLPTSAPPISCPASWAWPKDSSSCTRAISSTPRRPCASVW